MLYITSMGVGQINASVILNFRLRSPRNNEPQNSSAHTQSYEMTRGLSQTGVGMNSSTVPDSGEYEKTVPDSGEYETPEAKNHYGRWDFGKLSWLVLLCLYYPGITMFVYPGITMFVLSWYYYVCIILVLLCLYYPGITMFVLSWYYYVCIILVLLCLYYPGITMFVLSWY